MAEPLRKALQEEQLDAFADAVERLRIERHEQLDLAPLSKDELEEIGREIGLSPTQLREIDAETERLFKVGQRLAAEKKLDDAHECFFEALALAPWRSDIQFEQAKVMLAMSRETFEPVTSRLLFASDALELVDELARAQTPSIDLLYLQRELRSQVRSLSEQQRALEVQEAQKAIRMRRAQIIALASLVVVIATAVVNPILALCLIAIPFGLAIFMLILGAL